jgi:subtilisin family serine protease
MTRFAKLVGAMILLAAPMGASAQEATPVRVAVIDGGVVQKGVLKDAVETEIDMAGTRAPFSARTSHGSAVAAVIVRNAKRPVRIVSLRVDREDRCGRDHCEFDIAAVRAAVKEALRLKVDVINMSLDTPFDVQLYVMLNNATQNGIQIVMSAGNEKREPRALRYAQTIGQRFTLVGAKDQQGRPADFSARPAGDCGCRFEWRTGVDVPTQDRNGQSKLESGTSFAAPLLTAEIASTIIRPFAIASR